MCGMMLYQLSRNLLTGLWLVHATFKGGVCTSTVCVVTKVEGCLFTSNAHVFLFSKLAHEKYHEFV